MSSSGNFKFRQRKTSPLPVPLHSMQGYKMIRDKEERSLNLVGGANCLLE